MFRVAARRLAPVLMARASSTLAREGAAAAASTERAAWPLVVVAGGAGLWYAKENGLLDDFLGGVPSSSSSSSSKPHDYEAVKKAIADILDAEGYDDGSYGPVLVRLAWHSSGTYDVKTNTGGSNGAAMRFDPEASHGANAGLAIARSLLEPIKKKFPWISYADLYTLAGAVAVEELGGPKIEWRPGRSDFADGGLSAKDSRLPDASQGAKHLRAVFTAGMGFDDREIVALSGAHALGRCHTDRSGFDGPWTRAPTTFSSLYFSELVNTKWTKRKWDGPLQYTNSSSGDDLMMLPTDMALIWDRKFRPHVYAYAKDEALFFEDFAKAFSKLLELGVPRASPAAAAAAAASPRE